MKKTYVFIFLCFISTFIVAQDTRKPIDKAKIQASKAINRATDTLIKRMAESDPIVAKTHYTDFKIISFTNDTTIVDTTLTIQKDYTFNYIRKDDYELLPFHNQGQTFNRLAYSFKIPLLHQTIGAKAKHYNYIELDEVNYYRVPTPTTELMYRTGLEQGQVLDAFLTMNTSPQFNFSLAYKGLRSLGKYRNSLASQGNFRATFNYQSKKKQYELRGHMTSQDLMNQENGGLTDLSLAQFLSEDANYKQRGRLDVNYLDAETMLRGKRYFIEQQYHLLKIKKDTLRRSQITIGQSYAYETKHFEFTQGAVSSDFGDAFSSKIDDHAFHQQHQFNAYTKIKSPILLGSLKFGVHYQKYTYGFKSPIDSIYAALPDFIDASKSGFFADWQTSYKQIQLNAKAYQQVSGENTAKSLQLAATYAFNEDNSVSAFATTYSKSPDLNYHLYRSNYSNYNWYNDLTNEAVYTVGATLQSKKLFDAEVQLSKIDHYTYFDSNNPKPIQTTETLNYLKATFFREFTLNKFGLVNTIMYQKVTDGTQFMAVPEFTTRNTLYYATNLFKGDPLYIQTGVTLKYFTKFYAPMYNPLLGEFTQQYSTEIGNYPSVDFFLNGRIQRTRIYFKAENIGASLFGPEYFSAPYHPSRDFTVRFGLVWNFFI